MTCRRVLPALVLAVVFLAIPAHLLAQASLADPSGIEQNRDYLALLPFETLDTASANLLLRFTDLELPGNGGRTFRFGRVFNNALGAWSFGLEGVPLAVIDVAPEERHLPVPNAPDPIAAEQATAPHFVTLDGAVHLTTYVVDPDDTDDLVKVQTADFWRYNRDTRVLELCPTGSSPRTAQTDGSSKSSMVSPRVTQTITITLRTAFS